MQEFSPFIIYLVIINVAGFLLYFVNTLLHRSASKGKTDAVVTIVSLLGGSVGILCSMLIFDRKAKKENMMSRVLVLCVLVVQIILLLILSGHYSDHISFEIRIFFDRHRILTVYLAVMNMVTFAAFAIDKIAAMKQKSRIRIVTLLTFAFLGGSAGALIAMYLFRHKIRKDYFAIGIPLIMVMQMIVLFYAMNAAW